MQSGTPTPLRAEPATRTGVLARAAATASALALCPTVYVGIAAVHRTR